MNLLPDFKGKTEALRWMLISGLFPLLLVPLAVRNSGVIPEEGLDVFESLSLSFAMMMMAALPVMGLRCRLLATQAESWGAMRTILLWFPFLGFILATFFPGGGHAVIPWLLFLPPWAVSYTGMREMWRKAPRALALSTSRLLFMMLLLTVILQAMRYMR